MIEKQIVVIEDEPNVAEVVGLYLRRAGYDVVLYSDGKIALEELEKGLPMLVILDLMLPGKDGWSVTRWLRERSEVPIIILTARIEEMDRIAGLEMGADDYVMKPFSPQELVSRVRAVLRRVRSTQPKENEEVIIYNGLSINPVSRIITLDSNPINLTAKEFDLLLFLARNPQRVFTRDQLLDQVWGTTSYIDQETVTVHIRRLREKLETHPGNVKFLHTVWGVGYKFNYEPE
jgi:DNA-binding response OmpR family regulator